MRSDEGGRPEVRKGRDTARSEPPTSCVGGRSGKGLFTGDFSMAKGRGRGASTGGPPLNMARGGGIETVRCGRLEEESVVEASISGEVGPVNKTLAVREKMREVGCF
jgi:hypothetical protein